MMSIILSGIGLHMHGHARNRHEGPRRSGDQGKVAALFSRWPVSVKWALAVLLLVQSWGCTRVYYRKQADKEVSQILADKDRYPFWQIDNFHVYPDPQARFADPSDPDHPPKPPDDPAAYDLSPNPQKPGKAGVERFEGKGYLELIAKWDQENRAKYAEEEAAEKAKAPVATPAPLEVQAPPPDPSGVVRWVPVNFQAPSGPKMDAPPKEIVSDVTSPTSLDILGRPTYRLTLDQAAELAMFNSREYQDRRENLYLSALPVTLQRFSFTSQLFAASEASRNLDGRTSPGGAANNWNINSGAGLTKVLPTGALLLLNVANTTVFDFLNPKNSISTNSLNFSAVQPLLRGGGQAIALESLTQAERNLLYQIRSYARFRKELYVEIASTNGASISGSSFQPTGVLSGTSNGGSGAAGLGFVPGVVSPVQINQNGPIVPPSTPGQLNLTQAISPPPVGYLNTLLESFQIYIDKENIEVLNTILQRYRGLLEGDIVGPLQLQSVEQQLLTGRTNLLNDQEQYLDAVDSFKLEIGIPTQVNIEMDDGVLRPLMKQFRRSRAIIEEEQASVIDASRLIAREKTAQVRPELRRLFQESIFVRGTEFAMRISGRLAVWEKLSDKELKDRLDQLHKETQDLLNRQADLQKNDLPQSQKLQDRLKQLGSEGDLGNYERVLRKYEADYLENGQPKKLDPVGERRRVNQFRDVLSLWQKVIVEARDERWSVIRKNWPELPRCCVDGVDLITADLSRAEAAAAQHALLNRLDLMNVRAQVVDAWRQVAVFANGLLGTFNVGYNLNSSTHGGGIGGSGNAHQLSLNTSLPLVRIQERNNYRISQIAYQRQRRALQEAEDLAVKAVRGEIHLLRVYAESYRIQQRQLELAYLTIDSSLEALQAPTPPGLGRGGDGPAALTQQLLSAQRSLPAAQNALLTIWINYLNARLQLYRDLELMPIDARGVWIDEIRACDCSLNPDLPPAGVAPAGIEQRLPEPRQLPPIGAKKMD